MPFKHLTPMLATQDLTGTMEFYTGNLGFELDNFMEDSGWLHMHKDDIKLMFSLPNAHEPFENPVCTGSFYFYTDEVEELWEKLKDTPFVLYGMEDFYYGMREFAIKDNNGYTLQFGKELEA
jgi:uncharacterized glyoxalase superfamily protein PhnB